MKKNTARRGLDMGVHPYLYIAPALIALTAVVLLPLVYAFFLSLFKTHGLKGTFVGLANYISILSEGYFWKSTGRTAYFTIVSVALEFIIGMLVALLLNEKFR